MIISIVFTVFKKKIIYFLLKDFIEFNGIFFCLNLEIFSIQFICVFACSAEHNSTIVFPVPVEMFGAFMKKDNWMIFLKKWGTWRTI